VFADNSAFSALAGTPWSSFRRKLWMGWMKGVGDGFGFGGNRGDRFRYFRFRFVNMNVVAEFLETFDQAGGRLRFILLVVEVSAELDVGFLAAKHLTAA
jgi:hypothetical protein